MLFRKANPPSGTVYDPEGDGTRLASLGVHEHWNNPTDKQYSRNLGTGNGIELVVPSLRSADGPVDNKILGKDMIIFDTPSVKPILVMK